MSDSEENEKAQPTLAGFLFGNVDEDNKLDADYLDADVREQLQALGGDKLGLGESLQDFQEQQRISNSRSPAPGEIRKAEDAKDFFDEDGLIDYVPAEEKPVPSRPKAAPEAKGQRKQSVKAPHVHQKGPSAAPKMGLPVLARIGKQVLLRFSHLFATPVTAPTKAPAAKLRQPLPVTAETAEDEEETLHRHDAAVVDISSEEENSDANEEEADEKGPDDTKCPAASLRAAAPVPGLPRRRRVRRLQAGVPLQVFGSARSIPLAVPVTTFDAVQLLNWESNILWSDDSPQKVSVPIEEEERDTEDVVMELRQPEVDGEQGDSMAAKQAERLLEERILSGRDASTSNQRENAWLADGGWEEDVQWDSDDDRPLSPVALDMNDPLLMFQLLKPSQAGSELDKAAAQILPPLPKVKPVAAPLLGKGRIFSQLARQNVSQDEEYAKRKAKKGLMAAFKHKHAVPAMQLATLPPRYSDGREYEHRPRGVWVPPTSKPRAKVKEGEKSTVKVLSLVGHPKQAINRVFKGVDLTLTTLNMLWDVLKAGAKFADCAGLSPSQFGLWYRGAQPHALKRNIPIAETGAPQDANMELSLVVSGVQPLPNEKANAIPEALTSTPVPVAIQKSKQLTAADGHIVLLEYMEENPLLLSRPGMVVRATTYYRRTDASSDTGDQALLTGERWRTGIVESLQPNEEPPFLLGDVPPGKHQLALESNMYRSPGFPHPMPHSDFLLIRAASGAMSLREITGSYTVGQQEPLRRVPVPYSKECKDLEEARMVAYVMRELRRQKIRNEKKKQAVATEATITVRELAELFPSISDGIIRSRLKDRCNCIPFKDDAAGTFKLADGVTIADERELRQLVRPEEWCGHESMTAGLIRLAQLGVTQHDRLAALPMERLRIAIEQLSPPETYAVAAAELELIVQSTPWALTDNFVSAMREGRGSIALTGTGDPTARGEGFSYLKESVKWAMDKAVEAAPAVQDGNITGTNKDLRRLTMKESKTILLKLGLSEDDIKGLSRWQRIAAVRDLSTAAATEEDGELGKLGTRYARVAKASIEEQIKARRLQAKQIFERQVAALAAEDDGDSDLESWGDELEKELEDEKEEATKHGTATSFGKKDDDDELDDIEELRKGGFLKDVEEGSALQGKAKLDAKVGDRRIKRTIVFRNPAGERVTRTIFYTDRDKIQTLNELYKRDGKDAAAGFGKRTISGGGTWAAHDEEGGAKKATKKNMSKVQCKACGQMGHYKSNKMCPMYEQTYGKAAKAKKEAKAKSEAGGGEEEKSDDPLRITIRTGSLASPAKRKQSIQGGGALKRARSDVLSPGNARKQLGAKVLSRAVANAKRTVPENIWAPFRIAVTKASAPDYNDFVPAGDEMHMDKIEKKIKNNKYATGQEMQADFDQIVQNAAVYNAPGNGKFGGPAIVSWAETLSDAVRDQLQSEELANLLIELEESVRTEDAEKAAAKAAREAASQLAPDNDAAMALPVPEDAAMEHWVQCSKCQKWRKISQKVADETVASAPDAPWFCEWDNERPNASCDLPDDYEVEQA